MSSHQSVGRLKPPSKSSALLPKYNIRPPTRSMLLLSYVAIAHSFVLTAAFTTPQNQLRPVRNSGSYGIQRVHDSISTKLYNLFKDDDEDDDLDNYDFKTAAQIRKARKLLRDAKKKMEEPKSEKVDGGVNGEVKEEKPASVPLPFFAARPPSAEKIKSKTSSGIVADGATMTALSNSEPWELRPLNQMFVREPRSDYDGNLISADDSDKMGKLAEKDLARNILALKRELQNEDFKKVFDQRNRWIGDVD
ncbi:hypothetical protein ACHAXN_005600 [Cyclotella atomus]